jgi:hypothetical protein
MWSCADIQEAKVLKISSGLVWLIMYCIHVSSNTHVDWIKPTPPPNPRLGQQLPVCDFYSAFGWTCNNLRDRTPFDLDTKTKIEHTIPRSNLSTYKIKEGMIQYYKL